ncbi:DUF4357 domain-containing protein [Salinibacter ruber]|uniref:DUF4357 domain-containing protein n=1 Tax=Salinibacter ruber TaxID=146919 RepID=UPI00311AB974
MHRRRSRRPLRLEGPPRGGAVDNRLCRAQAREPTGGFPFGGGRARKKDGTLLFRQNYAFGFPSAAAGAVLGRSSNGWRDWTDGEGRTLDEIERS